MSQLAFNVAGDPGDDQPTLVADNPPGGTALSAHFEGIPGSPPNRFVAVVPAAITGGATLWYQKSRKSFRVIVPPGDGHWEAGLPPCIPPEYHGDVNKVALIYTPEEIELPVLEKRGQFYYLAGQPFSIIESSDFRLYERFLRNWDIVPVLEDRQACGFNTLRVWLLNTSVGHILPSEHPDFYARLPEFLGVCGRYGQYVEFTVFTQTKTLLPIKADQQAHYDHTVVAIGKRFAFIEGVNENDMHDNAFDPTLRMWKPSGATFDLCRGSNGSDSWALQPVIESTRYHTNDASEWQRKSGHGAMEMANVFNVPAWANENTRPDHDPNPEHHHDAARAAALLCAGYCHHDNAGKDSVVRTGLDRTCALAAVAGMREVDLAQRTQPYRRRDDLNVPGKIIRAYQRGTQIVTVSA